MDQLYRYPAWRRRIREGALGPLMEGLALDLQKQGYSRQGMQRILGYLGRLSRFAGSRGLSDAARVDHALIKRFLKTVRGRHARVSARGLARRLLHYHPGQAFPRRVRSTAHLPDRHESFLQSYDVHLRDVRGLSVETRLAYLRGAQLWLKQFASRGAVQRLTRLRARDVLDFTTGLLGRHQSAGWKSSVVARSRAFLRYLHWTGVTKVNLGLAVPHVLSRQLATIPRHIPWEKVEALIKSIDDSCPAGMRDKALVLLIASLGLRSGEACRLELSDVDWRAGSVRIRNTKNRRERMLPMPPRVGRALTRYLLRGRRRGPVPYVFVRLHGALGPLGHNGAITRIVARRLKRAGIVAPQRGPHMLRHSLATRMINDGVHLKAIADILGHVDLWTTTEYAKVDIARLSTVPLPFGPGGAGA